MAPVNSLGSALAALVSAGGKRIVRAKQSAAVKEAVFRADTLVALMAANLLEYLQLGEITRSHKNEEQKFFTLFSSSSLCTMLTLAQSK